MKTGWCFILHCISRRGLAGLMGRNPQAKVTYYRSLTFHRNVPEFITRHTQIIGWKPQETSAEHKDATPSKVKRKSFLILFYHRTLFGSIIGNTVVYFSTGLQSQSVMLPVRFSYILFIMFEEVHFYSQYVGWCFFFYHKCYWILSSVLFFFLYQVK